MKIVFHPEAYEELIESARFYEDREEGLGIRFLDAVEEAAERIQYSPHAGPIETSNIKRRFVPGFPFTILYQLEADWILIAAVMHQHRRPGYWRRRLTNT